MRKSDLTPRTWHKSSYSNGSQSCVEVADECPGVVPVRDSKNPDGPTLIFTADAWAAFVSEVKSSELNAS
ncbi:DUF397 domain-containing protein [Streptomyces sp. NPDC050617]|uniref:DUF397 domain-containing protein n=1 Tax=Streptomyces sp. NPDC050617 TaxID=3154628 RepID=UPI0034226267